MIRWAAPKALLAALALASIPGAAAQGTRVEPGGWEAAPGPPGSTAIYRRCTAAAACGEGAVVSMATGALTALPPFDAYRANQDRLDVEMVARSNGTVTRVTRLAIDRASTGNVEVYAVHKVLERADGSGTFLSNALFVAGRASRSVVSSAPTAEHARANLDQFVRVAVLESQLGAPPAR